MIGRSIVLGKAKVGWSRIEQVEERIKMTSSALPLTQRPAWKSLHSHYAQIHHFHLRQFFANDPHRGNRYTLDAVGLHLDYSKQRVNDGTLALLFELARESGLQERIESMFRGDRINITENRSVLHTALRAPKGSSIVVDGENVVEAVHEVLERLANFANRVRSGDWKGHTGKPIKNVVNIGIGGSDLGPVMAYEALKHYSNRELVFRFVSNIDGTDFVEGTIDLDPAETLFIVFVQNLHNDRNHDQCTKRACLVAQWPWWRRKGCCQTFCCRINQRFQSRGIWY